MEDAMILNKASFERGFAHASVYKSEVSTVSGPTDAPDTCSSISFSR